MKKTLCLLVLLLAGTLSVLRAQETFPNNGIRDQRAGTSAFTNATIVVDPATTLENAALLIREGVIEAVGQNIEIPTGYQTSDLEGIYLYPGLIDMYANYGQPEVKTT